MVDARLQRQTIIPDWDQRRISSARALVLGDHSSAASLYALGLAALGVNRILLHAPRADKYLLDVAQQLNKQLRLGHIPGQLVHPEQFQLMDAADVIYDASGSRLTNKLVIDHVVQGHAKCAHLTKRTPEGFSLFTYTQNRNWQELDEVLSSHYLLGGEPTSNYVLDHLLAGIALDETARVLHGQAPSDKVVSYKRDVLSYNTKQPRILLAGAGALGCLVALNLARQGYQNITIYDPDVVDITNLNRQVLLYGAEGQPKAQVLSNRINKAFGLQTKHQRAYIEAKDDVADYDAIFGCVDNHAARVLLSEAAAHHNKQFLSGGTSIAGGEAIAYDPRYHTRTPAQVLELKKIVKKNNIQLKEDRVGCAYEPDPSVIMSNQVIASAMVEQFEHLQRDKKPQDFYYDTKSKKKI